MNFDKNVIESDVGLSVGRISMMLSGSEYWTITILESDRNG